MGHAVETSVPGSCCPAGHLEGTVGTFHWEMGGNLHWEDTCLACVDQAARVQEDQMDPLEEMDESQVVVESQLEVSGEVLLASLEFQDPLVLEVGLWMPPHSTSDPGWPIWDLSAEEEELVRSSGLNYFQHFEFLDHEVSESLDLLV